MSFQRILIANRGEIACRVIRSAQALGYTTIAVYSEADRQARHVQMADEAIALGGSSVQESYLNPEALMQAMRRSGAEAVHPGYGFLSENATFAEACQKAGLIFIGPDPEAMALMGSKRAAKIAMIEAGVPCVPGYEGADQADESFIREADRIGYPVMIKASAGGGGRGMRKVDQPQDLITSLSTARSEARNAFGSDELILEKAVVDPRHVEIQVFADRHGNCLYLGERDCSIQRRHQKVVEESPCPVMTPELRQHMGEAAVAAAKSCQYVGAGTVEFLLDASGSFYFLEMNTRLQVEHPVTELVTGLDLVAWQIRVAAGEPLPITQDQVQLKGHAIEVRFYAEDPAQNFLPQTGPVVYFEPAEGEGIRIDHGLLTGGEVSPYYDPMLAKIIAWGENRHEACRRLTRAVQKTLLFGVPHNQFFLHDVLSHPAFRRGETHTGFIAQHLDQAMSLQPLRAEAMDFALAAMLFHERSAHPLRGWRTAADLASWLCLRCDEQNETLRIQRQDERTRLVQQGTQTLPISCVRIDSHCLVYSLDGWQKQVRYAWQDDRLWLQTQRGPLLFCDISHQRASGTEDGGSGNITAPMDGCIRGINIQLGQSVERGTVLMILEAMKMEHPIKADRDGVVRQLTILPGQQVKKRQLLVQLGDMS